MGNKMILPAILVMGSNGIRFIDNAGDLESEEMLNKHNEMKYSLVQSV